jgi:hypothetical protein
MFENLKLNHKVKKSADEIKHLRQLESDRDALKPASYALQPACEAAALQRQAWTLSHGAGTSPDRLKELDAECKRLEAQRDNPIMAANKLIGTQEDVVRRINRPFQSAFASWGRDAMQADPYNHEFTGCIQKAITEIESMSLQPLEEIVVAIERYRSAIESWEFTEKPKNALPMFRIQDAMVGAR